MNAVVERMPNPVAEIRQQLNTMEDQFKAALPAHIPAERFMRVVMTAVQNNGDLMKVNRRSLWNSAMRAAQDGLLPDGREGAIVPYKGEAQWMPMVGGIRKKVRNSGEIATWDVHAVYEHDFFEFELGDDPHIVHRPTLNERGKLIAVYSIATLKSGEKSRDVMSIAEVEKIREKSRAKNGPWADPTFYPEMAKKTVARRHAKVLPMSTDLDDLIRRDDDLYDFKEAREEAKAARPSSLGARLDLIASEPEVGEAGDPEAPEGPVIDAEATKPSTAAASSPDDWIADCEARMAECLTTEALNELWECVIAPEGEDQFPGDVAEVRKAFERHEARLADA